MAQKTLQKEKQQLLSEDIARKWVVIIYNDDHTSVGFVRTVLSEIFGKSKTETDVIIQKAESEGSAVVQYYLDPSMAEVAVAMVEMYKKEHDQPHFRTALFRMT